MKHARGSLLLALALAACETTAGNAPDAAGDATTDTARDATVPADAAPARPSCTARNTPSEIAARDGFEEVCADPAVHPRAVCGDGSGYRFSFRAASGASEGLLVYFQGGGACDDYVSCWGRDGLGGDGRRVSTLENERASAPVLAALGRAFGIFDRVDPQALFANFDVVYIAYCSGDGGQSSTEEVFARPANAEPSAPPERLTYFRGLDNVAAALDFARQRFATPSRLVIYGTSAGAYASMRAVPDVIDLWPTVDDVAYVGEGGAGVGREAYLAMADATIEAFDGTEGRRFVRFANFSHQSDATQIDFSPAGANTEAAFREGLRAVFEGRAARHPRNYRYFAAPGSCHTIANSVALYQAFTRASGRWLPVVPTVRPNPALTVEGASVVEWIRTVTRGQNVESHAGDWTQPSFECALP